MPRGVLRSAFDDAAADGAFWSMWSSTPHASSSHQVATSFLASTKADTLWPHSFPAHRRLGSSFAPRGEAAAAAASEDNAARDESPMGPAPTGNEKALEQQNAEGPQKGPGNKPFPRWANTEGLPTVTVASKSDKYFSPDIATGAGDGEFKPIFGCKCGDWSPAPTHPIIEFRSDFIESHPKFIRTVRKLKVHMEDVSDGGKVHWDATYDLKKFLTPAELARAAGPGGKLSLKDTFPAEKGSGEQIRFMTFCPPEPSAGDADHPPGDPQPHEYLLKVTALDADEKPVDDFVDDETRYIAAPPEAPQAPGPMAVPVSYKKQPIVATAKVSAA